MSSLLILMPSPQMKDKNSEFKIKTKIQTEAILDKIKMFQN
jgi:hypothetical protein